MKGYNLSLQTFGRRNRTFLKEPMTATPQVKSYFHSRAAQGFLVFIIKAGCPDSSNKHRDLRRQERETLERPSIGNAFLLFPKNHYLISLESTLRFCRSKASTKRHMLPSVHRSTVYDSHTMETATVASRGVGKEDAVRVYNGMVLSHKKEWNWAICRDVDGPRDCHTEWSKSERKISYNM